MTRTFAILALLALGCSSTALTSLLKTTTIAPGDAVCPAGGVLLSAGVDRNSDGVLQDAEVTSSNKVCDGFRSGAPAPLLKTATLDAGDSHCATGGVRIDVGTDTSRDGELQPVEISETRFVCHGMNGINGANGMNGTDGTNGTNGVNGNDGRSSLTRTTALLSGDANCPAGGVKLEVWLDTTPNGQIDSGELVETRYVCNGAPGTTASRVLVYMEALPPGDSQCPAGGLSFAVGYDTNNNGQLEENEAYQFRDVCGVGVGQLSEHVFPYDGFVGDFGSMRTTHWRDLEQVREIQQVSPGTYGTFVSAIRSASGPLSSNLDIANPTSVNDFGARITLRRYHNPTNEYVAAQLRGFFYNDTSATPTDRTGDVYSLIDVRGPETGITCQIRRCTNADCSQNTQLHSSTLIPPPNSGFSDHAYRMTYDGNVTFNYYVDGVLVKTQVSSAARVGPANNPARGVGTRVNTSNPAAYVMASFDDFRVNDALYDDFNAPSGKIDPAKWVTHELARDPTGGHDLRMRLGAHNTSRSVSARLTQPAGYFAISARVRVSEYASTGGYLRGRIVLATYNDGVLSGPPDSRASDIVAEVGVTDTQAFLQVVRCTSTSGSECLGTSLTDPQGIGRLPLGDVSLMSVHTLFLASNQATFVAQLDDNPPVRFDAAAAGAPLVRFVANVPVLELGARANLSSGQSGHITASFDEVRAGGVLHLD